jgi:Zn-dependent peptidase ImmA (M78 family)/transcriptional regulator with XRE-family HTH domain
MIKFNPEMLKLARDAKGLTQKDLAALLQCTQSRLSKIEDGACNPSESDFSVLLKELGRPPEFFFFSGNPRASTMSFYRKTSGIPLKTLAQCEAEMNIARLELSARASSYSLRTFPTRCPDRSCADPRERGAKIARELRQEWGIPPGPIKELSPILERAGCVVMPFDPPVQKIDGASFAGTPPVIFFNRQACADRTRFTLAHETAHAVMHWEPHCDVEDEANGFGAEFLMPKADIDRDLTRCNLEVLARLKIKWGVSMRALLLRAQTLKKIDERSAKYLWIRLGQFRLREPFEESVPKEKPKLYAEIIGGEMRN